MKTLQIVFASLLAGGFASAQDYTISTIAGLPNVQGWWGDNAAANQGQLDKPWSVAVDSKGNFYILDSYTSVVRMVTASTGIIVTISGNGTPGYEDAQDVYGCPVSGNAGPANSTTAPSCMSELGYLPENVAVDSSGNVYVADTNNFRIRKVDTSGNTTTFAGNGTRGYTNDGMAASNAELYFPAALAFDSSGNLYVADYGNHTVRKIAVTTSNGVATSGNITTVAGNGAFGYSGDGGAATSATLGNPISLAIDSANNIYIGDVYSHTIRKVTTDGNIHTLYSNITAQSLAVDAAGNIYFVDGLSPTVQKILPGGTILTIAGIPGQPSYGGDGGDATAAQLNLPESVAVDSSGRVYVADMNNDIIRLLTPAPNSLGAVTNAASGFQGAIAPGEIVAVFGSGIGPSTLTEFSVVNGYIASQIAGTQVYISGYSVPLIYASPNLIAAITPFEIGNSTTATVTVVNQGLQTNTLVVPVATAVPGIFTANATGSGQAAAVNQNGSLNSASNPASRGTFVSLYITGAGQTSPAGTDGLIAGSAPYPQTVQQVTAQIGGQSAMVTYAGVTPSVVQGLTQVNVQIPMGIQPGSAIPVALQVAGINAQSGVTLAVQ
ncbi:MAG: hypothetical protein ABSB15_14040 [Bryobacteraceae bacterium]|jgi:uncharacterized protein (TIGR03437 family)